MDSREIGVLLYMQALKDHFGSISQLAELLGIDRYAIYKWKYEGSIPLCRAHQIYWLSHGTITASKVIIRKPGYKRKYRRLSS